MIVRQLKQSDRADWQRLYFEYLEFYESTPNAESTELVWQRLTAQPPQIQNAVVEDDGELAGFAHFHFQMTTWAQTGYCYLEDLYVDQRFRNHGLATALIDEVKRAAIDQRCTELFWITRESNVTARSLYRKVANEADYVRYEIPLTP
ncbi:MAG: hypothetical protein RLZZ345_1092 [Actinomycetota bacterium]|jgi:ribosomal protein S18 acetylase RimI-like enzyme